ncbi:MAG: hypothetical protein CR982_04150 [Candidatus Cloacimonadota bacterium]|nr:MAG: hypothetical protein CR982_04150 [Candidatus Cloacimonadota bacterium]PIE78165.1 MAG: hypothetical protein CSA15_09250 [Candidatus Delongbacteria bacterium]
MRFLLTIILAVMLTSCILQQQTIKKTPVKNPENIKRIEESRVNLKFVDLDFYPLGEKGLDSKYRVKNDIFNGFEFGKIGYTLSLISENSGSFELTEEWYKDGKRVEFYSKSYDVSMGKYTIDGNCKKKLKSGSYTLKFIKDGSYLGEKSFFIK